MGTDVRAKESEDSSRSAKRDFAFTVLALGLASLAISAAAASLLLWTPQSRDLLGAVVLILGFAVARQVAIEVDIRQSSWRLVLTEVPLIIGLLLVPGPVVAGSYTLVVFVARLLRGDSWQKLAINVSQASLLVTVTDLTAQMLVRPMLQDAPSWVVVLLGFMVGQGLMAGAAYVTIRIHGVPGLGSAGRLVAHTYVTGLLAAVAGLVAVQLVIAVPLGGLLVALFGIGLVVFYRGYYALLREQRDLGLLNKISLRMAGAGRRADDSGAELDDEVWVPTLELVREQLNATRVVLHRRLEVDRSLRTVVAGEPLPEGAPRDDLSAVIADGVNSHLDPGVHRITAPASGGAAPGSMRALERRGAKDALLAPLRGSDELLGLIEVHDRQNRLLGFGDADVRLVETLASHLTTAMDNRRLLGRLRYDAYHDSLTGLCNRLGFREAATEVLHRHEKSAIVVLDLDVLSSVNDTLGHAWGDHIVVSAGRRLRDALPSTVLTARLEGDTFAAVLADVETDEVLATAERVRAVLSEAYPVDKLAVECSAVVGVAETTVEPTFDVDVLLQRADVAVQAARSGNVAVRRYVPSMGQVFLRRFQLVTQFRQALDEGQVDVHFQPKVALPGREVTGVEALVRWRHPDFGMLDPEEFVTVVEATGLIDALTNFVLEVTLRQCRAWLDRGLRLAVAVNLSVRNLADAEFPDRVAEALRRHNVPATLLAFELTESAVMSDPERALPVLRRLHALGIHLAVDDFGTGYSSLAYLRRLPVDEVKIDKSFVLGMGTDLGDLAVVRAIVDLGHSLGLTVVAEGVEEDASREQLIEMGCDIAQGFLISRPMGPERFDAWLRARTVWVRGRHDETVLTLVR